MLRRLNVAVISGARSHHAACIATVNHRVPSLDPPGNAGHRHLKGAQNFPFIHHADVGLLIARQLIAFARMNRRVVDRYTCGRSRFHFTPQHGSSGPVTHGVTDPSNTQRDVLHLTSGPFRGPVWVILGDFGAPISCVACKRATREIIPRSSRLCGRRVPSYSSLT